MANGNVDLSKSLLDEFEARLARGDSLTNKELIWLLNLARGVIMPVWEVYKRESAAKPSKEKTMPEVFAEICFAPSEKHSQVSKENVCAILPVWFKRYVSSVALEHGERGMARYQREVERRFAQNHTHYLGIGLTDEGKNLLQAATAQKGAFA